MPRLAAIDIGSNTVHTLIVETRPSETWKRISSMSEFVGLGEVVARQGRIPSSTFQTLKRVLNRDILTARRWKVDTFLIAATAAMRRAANGQDVASSLQKHLGLPVHIVSAHREGVLGFLGVETILQARGRQLTIDSGGGSTELTLTEGRRRIAGMALPIGTGMLLSGITGDPPHPLAWARILIPIQDAVRKIPRGWTPRRAVVIGGSARQFSKLVKSKIHAPITLKELDRATQLLLSRPAWKLGEKYDIKPQRIRVLPVASLIIGTLLDHFKLSRFEVTRLGLRDGMVRAFLQDGARWNRG